MSESKVSKDAAFKRVKRDYTLAGGFKVILLEPCVGSTENDANLVALSKVLISINTEDLSKTEPLDIQKNLRRKNIVMTTALISKMTELLSEVADVERQVLKPDEVLTDLLQRNTVSRKVEIKSGGRTLKAVLRLPETEDGSKVGSDDIVGTIATFCVELNGFKKEDDPPSWREIVALIPYNLGKVLTEEYNRLFEYVQAHLLDDEGLKKRVENF